jgi:NAD(P)-dependent dehydrogenase (short-subunit alcohol dehydrogenase family)
MIFTRAMRETVQTIESGGDRGYAIQADIADSMQVKAMFAEAATRFGVLHILVTFRKR